MSVELVDRRKAKSDVWKHFGFPADAHGAIHFPIAHTLQLSIKNGLAISRVQRVLGQCKKLVEHFKKSTKEKYKLREKQEMLKLPQHKLIQDCVTRWGSTLGMLESLMEQQAAIAAVLKEGKVRHLMPEGDG
jgi:hypothetical protein